MPEIGGVAGPRQQGLEPVGSLGRVEWLIEAEAQDLRQVVEQAGRGQQRVDGTRLENPGLTQVFERLDCVLAQDVRMCRRVHELQMLDDEFQVDQTPAY